MLQENLTKIRKSKGLTQTDLAERCGFSRNSIVNWETGKREPKIGDIKKLAEALEVSPNDLLDDNSDGQIHLQMSFSQSKGLAYWGGIVDEARKVAQSEDLQEIRLITPLLRSALDILIFVQEKYTHDNSSVSSGVSAFNGSNSSYKGNTMNVGATTV